MIGQGVRSSALAIEGYPGAFARNEWVVIDGRHVVLMLIKNTVSLSETVRLGASYAPDAVMLGLNDAAADGRDVSWVWDAPIAELVTGRHVVLTGARAADLRLRLKYDPETSAAPPAIAGGTGLAGRRARCRRVPCASRWGRGRGSDVHRSDGPAIGRPAARVCICRAALTEGPGP